MALVSSPKMSGGVRTAGTMDPVLEAECYLVACRIFKQLGDDNSLSLYLEKWNNVSPFIDNYYLHHDAKALPLPGKKEPFHTNYDFEFRTHETPHAPTIVHRLELYEKWLLETILRRNHGIRDAAVADIYGQSRNTVIRRLAALGIKRPRL